MASPNIERVFQITNERWYIKSTASKVEHTCSQDASIFIFVSGHARIYREIHIRLTACDQALQYAGTDTALHEAAGLRPSLIHGKLTAH